MQHSVLAGQGAPPLVPLSCTNFSDGPLYCVMVVGTTSELVCSVKIYELTSQAPAQTAQQFDLTRSTARGFSAWQLSDEHRLALQRQAEEHHRDYG